MDENTVRLWLKDHQDAVENLVQQQAATFQAQFDTLRAELQATRGLLQNWQGIFAINEYFSLLNTFADQRLRIVGFNLEGTAVEWFRWMTRNGLITTWARVTDIPNSLLISFYIYGLKLHLQREFLVSKPTTLCDVFSLARTVEARLDDQAAPVAGMSAGVEANKVVNDGDGEVKVLNLVQQAINVKSTSDNDARDQASELKTNVLVDGKQDEAKVVGVADDQNVDEPNVLEGNGVIGVGVNENKKGVDKKVQYSVNTLHVLIPLLKRLNDKYKKKKKMEAAIQRRLRDPEIKSVFQDNTLRARWL
ncbi:hypothetical protein Tco_0631372 [Tanacetum coccineum]